MARTAAARKSSRSKWYDTRTKADAATALPDGVAPSVPSRNRSSSASWSDAVVKNDPLSVSRKSFTVRSSSRSASLR